MESIEPPIERISWDEDSYGIFKRWIVFRAWVEVHAERRDMSRLRVLDYGCGTGALVAYPLALLGHTVLGSDIHDPSIALARARYQFFHGAGFVVERRARTLLCGPYLDQLLTRLPFRHLLYRFNGRLADSLPFSWAADWMFLLERREKSAP